MRRTRPVLIVLVVSASACGSSATTSVTATAPTNSRCQATLTTSSSTFGSGGGTGSVSVSVARECAWTAASQAAWIQISSATTGQGDGSVSFKVASNADPMERRGALGVADQIASVTQQAAPCKFDVQASAQEIGSTGGQTPVVVQTQDACTWNASSNATWVSLTPVSGHGTASITATALPNNGAERSAMVMVGQGQLLLRQAAAAASPIPSPVPAPTPGPTPAPNPPPPSPTPPPTPPAAAHAGAWSLTQSAARGQRGERQTQSPRRRLPGCVVYG